MLDLFNFTFALFVRILHFLQYHFCDFLLEKFEALKKQMYNKH